MRGKPWLGPLDRDNEGLIPAHTGKTSLECVATRRRRAHPRSRGENRRTSGSSACRSGSSPLMRGKRSAELFEVAVQGLIPTHAGKTWSATERSPSRTAHPRSRGENLVLRLHENHGRGSSPLTRGELACDTQGVDVVGLIPTHAGKTAPSQCKTCARRAHPRSRGENGHGHRLGRHARGSSPLMRGKPDRRHRRPVRPRLIPAHAGKPSSGSRRASGGRAHPRSCGENAFCSATKGLR